MLYYFLLDQFLTGNYEINVYNFFSLAGGKPRGPLKCAGYRQKLILGLGFRVYGEEKLLQAQRRRLQELWVSTSSGWVRLRACT